MLRERIAPEIGVIAVVSRPANQERVPLGDGVVSRKMDADHDAIMTDEQLASSLGLLHNDLRVLITLGLAHGNVHTAAGIRDFFQQRGLPGDPPLDRKVVASILRQMADTGVIDKTEGDKGVSYSMPEWSDTLAAQAGFLGDFSRQYSTRVSQLIGGGSKDSHQSTSNEPPADHTLGRIRTLRYISDLKRRRNPFSLIHLGPKQLAEVIGISVPAARRHLDALGMAGIITHVSINTSEGSYQQYRLAANIPDGKPEPIQNKASFSDWVREYGQMHFYEDLSVDDAFSYIWQNKDGVQDADPAQLKVIYRRTKRAMDHLKERHEIEPVNTDPIAKAAIYFEPGSQQVHMFRDFILTLFDMQREDSHGELEGLKKGKALVNDHYAVSQLLRKAYSERKIMPQDPLGKEQG